MIGIELSLASAIALASMTFKFSCKAVSYVIFSRYFAFVLNNMSHPIHHKNQIKCIYVKDKNLNDIPGMMSHIQTNSYIATERTL